MSNKVERIVPVEAEVIQDTDAEASFSPPVKRVSLRGKEEFVNAISQYKAEITQMVQAGVLSEQNAIKLILDAEYGFFQQLVGIEYN